MQTLSIDNELTLSRSQKHTFTLFSALTLTWWVRHVRKLHTLSGSFFPQQECEKNTHFFRNLENLVFAAVFGGDNIHQTTNTLRLSSQRRHKNITINPIFDVIHGQASLFFILECYYLTKTRNCRIVKQSVGRRDIETTTTMRSPQSIRIGVFSGGISL